MSRNLRHIAAVALLLGGLAPTALAPAARAHEPDRLTLSGSHWDGSGSLQLMHPSAIARKSGYVGAWAGLAEQVGWTNEPFRRSTGIGLQGAWAPARNLRLEASLPTWPSLVRSDSRGNEFVSSGVGDLRFGGTFAVPLADGELGLAANPWVTLPTGDPALATGGQTAGGLLVALGGRTNPSAATGGPVGGVGWRINAGWHGGGAPEASGVLVGAGLDAGVAPGVVLGAELTRLLRTQTEGLAANTANPLDANAYLTVGIDEHLLGSLVGGGALIPGEGSPKWRAMVALGWRASGVDADPDGDGVLATADLCPNTPEGPGGDGDGCPDPDRDGDGVPDGVDACPTEPEDLDGYKDRDGCPEEDNDQDGLLDSNDACPMDFGTLDTQGCPDFDGDGIADRSDECPESRGPARSFGCPDMDSDDVPDYRDRCPAEPDAADADPLRSDGCPGLAYAAEGRIFITDQVRFDIGRATIRPESEPVLAAVAQILNRNTDILLVEVAGHSDATGGDALNLRLSRMRAAATRDWLIKKGGVDARRLVARGYGESLPMDSNATDQGRFFNRRVEFLIQRVDANAGKPGADRIVLPAN